VLEEEVDEDKSEGEWWKKPYNMGKHGQESNRWQGIVYAGDALWMPYFPARSDRNMMTGCVLDIFYFMFCE
jgi:hypothetical protein